MNQAQLESLLLTEIQSQIVAAARDAVSKLSVPVPPEARADYLSPTDVDALRRMSPVDFEHPLVKKSMTAAVARVHVLSYPPDGHITEEDAAAMESLGLTDPQRRVLERVVAEACHAAFFHFFCLLDSVADPKLTPVEHWAGARFSYRRKEGPMLHDELGEAYHAYQALIQRNGPSASSVLGVQKKPWWRRLGG
jgi:hypothetical protein